MTDTICAVGHADPSLCEYGSKCGCLIVHRRNQEAKMRAEMDALYGFQVKPLDVELATIGLVSLG